MSAPDPYRDELRAAQNRIALLEKKLADRGPSDDDDPDIVLLTAARRSARRWGSPRIAAGRALVGGLGTTLFAAAALGWIASTFAHANVARLAILAIGSGVVVTGLLYAIMVATAASTIKSVDRDLAKRKRLNAESRRLANIDHLLRAGKTVDGASTPRVRMQAADDAEPEAEAEEEEEARDDRQAKR